METIDERAMKFLLIEDHPVFRKALRDLIFDSFPDSAFREASTVKETLRIVNDYVPDFIIIDLELFHSFNFDLIDQLHQTFPAVPILVISMYGDSSHINRALKSGANGYITKHDAPEHIERAIHALLQGSRYLSEKASSALVQSIQNQSNEERLPVKSLLSKREFEIFSLLGSEYSRKEIADRLNVSLATIDTHIDRIKTKLNFDTGHKLLCFAIRYKST